MKMLGLFINQLVIIDTPIGSLIGVLVRHDRSLHNGIGCLLLQRNGNSWTLIKNWLSIKRKAKNHE